MDATKYSMGDVVFRLSNMPFREVVERVSTLGFDGIELWGEPKLYDLNETRELLSSYGLAVAAVAGIFHWKRLNERDLCNADEKVRRRAVKYLEQVVDFASATGAPVVIATPQCLGKTEPTAPIEEELGYAKESFRAAGRYAEERDVTIAIELVHRYHVYLLNDVKAGLNFLETIGLESVKIMLDTFHMNIEEPDPAHAIKLAGNRLVHMHVADSNRQAVGRGHIDFKRIMLALKEIGYSRFLTMEPLPKIADTYSYVREGMPKQLLEDQFIDCRRSMEYLQALENETEI